MFIVSTKSDFDNCVETDTRMIALTDADMRTLSYLLLVLAKSSLPLVRQRRYFYFIKSLQQMLTT